MLQDKRSHDELNENGGGGNDTARFLVEPAGNPNSKCRKQGHDNNQYGKMFSQKHSYHLLSFLSLLSTPPTTLANLLLLMIHYNDTRSFLNILCVCAKTYIFISVSGSGESFGIQKIPLPTPVIVSASVIRKKHVRGTKKQHLNVLIYKYLILIILGGVVVKKMDKKVLRGLLILVVCVVFVASVVSVFVLQSEVLIGILYGAAGVGLFMLLAKVLTLIQKEGKQDD